MTRTEGLGTQGHDSSLVEGAAKTLDAHIWVREENEHYVEPEWCSRRLFEEEAFEGGIYDPCCGFGTIVISVLKHGLKGYGSDLIDRGWDSTRTPHDFMSGHDELHDNIVCNPPFNIADKFALHALKLSRRKVALIFPVARLNAAHWLKGLPLRRTWLMTPRLSMPPGHVIKTGGKPGGGKMDYCWIVFEHSYSGASELRWLRRDKSLSSSAGAVKDGESGVLASADHLPPGEV
jgi:hypothetical protein